MKLYNLINHNAGGQEMKNSDGISWEDRKAEFEDGIDELLKKEDANKDIYLLMKELLKSAKTSTSIEDYYEETKE